MDPVTAALNLANTIAQIVLLSIQAMPEEQRAEWAKLQLAELQKWHALLDRIIK